MTLPPCCIFNLAGFQTFDPAGALKAVPYFHVAGSKAPWFDRSGGRRLLRAAVLSRRRGERKRASCRRRDYSRTDRRLVLALPLGLRRCRAAAAASAHRAMATATAMANREDKTMSSIPCFMAAGTVALFEHEGCPPGPRAGQPDATGPLGEATALSAHADQAAAAAAGAKGMMPIGNLAAAGRFSITS